MNQSNKRAAGFSLVEVSLAMMIISVGMITLFGLFPASLKQGEEAYQDTHTAQFAEYVLNGMRANFDGATSFADWSGSSPVLGLAGLGVSETLTPLKLQYPRDSGTWVRYILELTPPGGSVMNWRVSLWAWSGEYGPSKTEDHKLRSQWFATEIFYEGMQ
jgi:prepilin-type N-terminal cleavage/methylation domain-containing protein